MSAAAPPPLTGAQVCECRCPFCGTTCQHIVLFQNTQHKYFEEALINTTKVHQVLQCTHCSRARERHLRSDSDQYHSERISDEEGLDEEQRTYYYLVHELNDDGLFPIGTKRPTLDDSEHTVQDTSDTPFDLQSFLLCADVCDSLPARVRSILMQVQQLATTHSWIMWSMGLRMLVEEVCSHFGVYQGNLADAIVALSTHHIPDVPAQHAPRITEVCLKAHAVRCFGNEAAHQREAVPEADRVGLFKLVEHLLRAVFLIPQQFRQFGQALDAAAAGAIAGTKHPREDAYKKNGGGGGNKKLKK